ncbi:MAG: bifunctional DNA primase/polymerase [Nitrospirota bacterium]|nr:bifunctional DNA primase/polymerase [Nitrospirota bacterium]
MTSPQAAALDYSNKRGWSVIPLDGKIPILRDWPNQATTDPNLICTWWTHDPSANVGIVTGEKSNLIVLDVDPDNGGDDSLRSLEARYGPLPATPEVLTGGGGRHLYFQYPGCPLGNSAGKLGPGLDIRADGGQVVAPPSIHPKTGGSYEWEVAHHPDDVPPAPLPDWLLRLMTTKGEKHVNRPSQIFHDGSRNDSLTQEAGKLRRIGLSETELQASLSAINQERCRPPLDENEVRRIAQSISRYLPVQDIAPTWPVLNDAALHGLAGEVVRLIGPHTEADPVALLVSFLSEFGAMLNRSPYLLLDGFYHPLLFWPVLVGQSSKSRKGTAGRRIETLLSLADESWTRGESKGTLSTGEGLAFAVRDAQFREEPVKQGGKPTGEMQTICIDSGVDDKRLFLVQSEFGAVLKVMARDGNSLSGVLRDAWDGLTLAPMTKANRVRASNPHIGIVSHVTQAELLRNLTDTETVNGFGNRFVWFAVRRSKELPFPSAPDESNLSSLARKVGYVLPTARTCGELALSPSARELWVESYHDLSADRPGLTGALLGRAEAQVMRLSGLYAVMDGQSVIDLVHLKAALAIWQYAEASTRMIFGDSLGDPVADAILKALRTRGDMTDSDISDFFRRHKTAAEL